VQVETIPSKWPEGFSEGSRNREAMFVLMSLRGIEPRKLLELATREGTASACLAAVRDGRAGSPADRLHAGSIEPEAVEAAVRACGSRFVVAGSPEYPPQLNDLHDPPAALFVRGRPLPGRFGTVAVVGARRCSDLGGELSRTIGRGLATSGLCVVSGAARGIDAAAHEGALAAGGHTVAILGCGIDRPYPSASRALIARIVAEGTLASEYPPGVPAEPFRFPARNRLVAALSTALVVVEGAERSGSLISARHALGIGRDVFAVPGSVTNPLSYVPHTLIRDGAALIRGVDDLMDDLGLLRGADREALPIDLTVPERAALDVITTPVLPERIARDIGIGVPDAISLLMRLEMKGLVVCVGGRYERRLRAAAT
jgi:DNA processing protein